MNVLTREPVAAPPTTGRPPPSPPGWRLDAGILAVVALLLRFPALFASRHLSYDDGSYGLAAVAMRQGHLPFRDVFSSQGPLHQPLLFVFDLVGWRTLNAPRLYPVAAGVFVTVATYAVARRFETSRAVAIGCALLVSASGSVLRTTGPVTSDGPAMACAVLTIALALRYAASPSRPRAVAVGAAGGAALAIKVLVVPFAIPVAVLVLWRRRFDEIVLVAGTAVAVPVLAALPWGPTRVWDQAVRFHQAAPRERGLSFNVDQLRVTLRTRDRLVVWIAVLAIAVVVARLLWRWWSRRGARPAELRGAGGGPAGDEELPGRPILVAAFLGWAAATVAVLVLEPWQFTNHVAHMVPPLVLLVALAAPSWWLMAAVAVSVVPGQYEYLRPSLDPEPYGVFPTAAVDAMRDLPGDGWVVSDAPELVWRSGHGTDPGLVDASIKRILQGELTADDIVAAADDERVCAVLIWKKKFAYLLDDLPDRLEGLGYAPQQTFGHIQYLSTDEHEELHRRGSADRNDSLRTLFVRADCG